jgi:hypothetical protein
MTTPHELWTRYAAIWSASQAARALEMEQCLAAAPRYADPNVSLDGRTALSAYMGQFQASMPGCRFSIDRVAEHHARSLASWRLVDRNGAELQSGVSFARHDDDGRLEDISGFFPLG